MNKLFDERRTAIVKSRIAKRKHKNKCVICKGEIKKGELYILEIKENKTGKGLENVKYHHECSVKLYDYLDKVTDKNEIIQEQLQQLS